MRPILEYLRSLNGNQRVDEARRKIKATDKNIKAIVVLELEKLGLNADLNHIDVSEVTDMSKLFSCQLNNGFGNQGNLDETFKDLNPDISKWDVRNLKNADYMFCGCEKFNCDLSKWNVSKLESASSMFEGCFSFNGNISTWDVSNLTDAHAMFSKCRSLSQDLSNWKTLKKCWISDMFDYCRNMKKTMKPAFSDESKYINRYEPDK